MSIKHALLGFLNYHPYTGYDLKSIFDRSIQHFWSADQSQIYRALAQIADEGWADIQVIHQDDRPDRKVYHITAAGQAELTRWLTGPVPVERSRSAPMIMVFFAGMLSNEEALPIFQQAVAYMRGALAQYQQAPAVINEFGLEIGSAREAYFWNQTLELGRAVAEAQLAWAQRVVEELEAGTVPEHKPE
ncbi:MAG: PadR family transcriptional regulator [Caldilineaceae bacterium]|nr:PadR family transcriptional regulator [Caldilineaceae bacterium]